MKEFRSGILVHDGGRWGGKGKGLDGDGGFSWECWWMKVGSCIKVPGGLQHNIKGHQTLTAPILALNARVFLRPIYYAPFPPFPISGNSSLLLRSLKTSRSFSSFSSPFSLPQFHTSQI